MTKSRIHGVLLQERLEAGHAKYLTEGDRQAEIIERLHRAYFTEPATTAPDSTYTSRQDADAVIRRCELAVVGDGGRAARIVSAAVMG